MTTDISVVRWDPAIQQDGTGIVEDYEYDGGNSSSRLFERSRIKALAGKFYLFYCPETSKKIKTKGTVISPRTNYKHTLFIEWGRRE